MIDYDSPAIDRKGGLITTSVGKAASGPGMSAFLYQRPLEELSTTPQKLAWQAQMLYHQNAIVAEAEDAVSVRGAAVPLHLEDEAGNEIDDESPPQLQAIRDLIEKPQAQTDRGYKASRRTLWEITLRHMGLCGTAFWLLDQLNALAGTPLGILEINPARMFATMDKSGNLLGWTVDKPAGEQGAIPLELREVVPFYLRPPDFGYFGIGKVESIWAKAQLNMLVDRHESQTLAAGGRLAGMITPKVTQGAEISDDQWTQLVRDYRGITEDNNAARRLQIIKGAVDFTRTAATMQELAVVDMGTTSREDILAHWGVPGSQTGRQGAAGLNSGETKGFDKQILWQGAIHPRLNSLYEGIQYGILDRFAQAGIVVELVIDEPDTDDAGPAFEQAQKSQFIAMRNVERRSLIGLPPFGDPALDNAIIIPTTTSLWATAPDEDGNPVEDMSPPVDVVTDLQTQLAALKQASPGTIAPAPVANATPVAKATIRKPFLALRSSIDRTHTPAVKEAVAHLLAQQKGDVLAKVRRHFDHIKREGRDTSVWWNGSRWDRLLKDAIAPHAEQIAEKVSAGVARKMPKPAAKATAFSERVTQRVLDRGAARIAGINQTTRDGIAAILANPDYDTLGAVTDAIEAWSGFDEARSELIARTETMDAYNAAAIGSYSEFGVTQVEAVDGDGDEECAERDGQVFDIDEADSIEDHPNGTLDWMPVIDEGKASTDFNPTPELLAAMRSLIDFHTAKANLEAQAVPPAIHVHVPDQVPPDIYVQPQIAMPDYPAIPVTVNLPEMAPVINVPAKVPAVHVHVPEPGAKRVTRDKAGNITGIEPA